MAFAAETGSSDDPCSEVFQGARAFSEPESRSIILSSTCITAKINRINFSRALRDMLLSPELKGKTEAYITFHTYAQMWMYPFGHQRNQVPNDVNDLVCFFAVSAMRIVTILYGAFLPFLNTNNYVVKTLIYSYLTLNY